MQETIKIETPFIKLDSLLKFADIGGSGGMSKMIIQDGLVEVNGEINTQRGKKIYPGNTIKIFLEEEITLIIE